MIEISKAVTNETEEIQRVFYETWLATYPNEDAGVTVSDIEDLYAGAFSQEKLQLLRDSIENPADNQTLLVAHESGKVVGVCRIVRREEYNQLQAIYVLPNFQRKGIGSGLWKASEEFLEPGKDTVVEVATYNQPAIEFYKRLGFKDTGERFKNERFRMKSGAVIPEMRMRLQAL
ncbi:MAG: GNAT family N-acetyltransferase [Candidatus Pacebacteria bacterium]|nr:GNAT family N-acetyltransferase [Candidatus Paceibacterota bacterium]